MTQAPLHHLSRQLKNDNMLLEDIIAGQLKIGEH